jgi:hypothetical protein
MSIYVIVALLCVAAALVVFALLENRGPARQAADSGVDAFDGFGGVSLGGSTDYDVVDAEVIDD